MTTGLLHVISCVLRSPTDVKDALVRARRCGGERTLLFCDLADAPAQKMPGDDALIRKIQSGVMSIDARKPDSCHLLVRRRAWDAACRMYLGQGQMLSIRHVVAQLIRDGHTDAVFDAATLSPSGFRDRFSAVLFSSVSLLCTPETPQRMLDALLRSSSGCICAEIRHPHLFPEPVLARLARTCGFSLCPLRAAGEEAQRRQGLCSVRSPAIFTAKALTDSFCDTSSSAPSASGCFFVRSTFLTLDELYASWRSDCLRENGAFRFLPIVQMALLFVGACLGQPVFTACALLPEICAPVRPRLLPGAVLRTALLPLTASVSLDALLCRLMAQSPFLSLRVPDSLVSELGSMLAGAALLASAAAGAGALVYLLPVSLLWLGAPLLHRALASPTIERIPLDGSQLEQLRALAENAFFACSSDQETPAMQMLAACAASMLSLLEPDEAARRVQALLARRTPCSTAFEQASMLACAQHLRERMADCDAALRALPAELEKRVRSVPLPQCAGMLCALLAASRQAERPATGKACGADNPLDALFLPLRPAKDLPQHALTLPLTHPHTFLMNRQAEADMPSPGDCLARFLSLAAAALGHPFFALLQRSPVTGPYMPMISA